MSSDKILKVRKIKYIWKKRDDVKEFSKTELLNI